MHARHLFGLGGALVLVGPANAGLLNIDLLDTPDTLVQGIDLSYNAAADAFSADGLVVSLDQPPLFLVAGGAFDLDASIDDSGTLASGSFTISGTIASLGFNSGTLLTGTLTDFGFNPGGGDPFEFIFEVTGGDAASLYGGLGTAGGIILSQTSFPGDFLSDFNQSFAVADVGVLVPAPGVAGVLLVPMLARRRRSATG